MLLHYLFRIKVYDSACNYLFLCLTNFELAVQQIPIYKQKYIRVKLMDFDKTPPTAPRTAP